MPASTSLSINDICPTPEPPPQGPDEPSTRTQSLGSPVADSSVPVSLTTAAMFVAVFVGVLFGLLAGRFRDTPIDIGGRLFGIVAYAMPAFFLGLLAQLVFGVWLGWLPTSDQSSPLTQALLTNHTPITDYVRPAVHAFPGYAFVIAVVIGILVGHFLWGPAGGKVLARARR